jgi:uncharacterized protein (TIGR02147 family)
VHFSDLLETELDRRKQVNPRYSLRKFASDLGLSSPFLSRLLQREKRLSDSRAIEIAKALPWSATRRALFTLLARRDNASSDAARRELDAAIAVAAAADTAYTPLDGDAFKVIARWYHAAILELVTIAGFEPTPRAIAARLRITALEAELAVDRLLRVGALVRKGDRLEPSDSHVFAGGVPSKAIRSFHADMLAKAGAALAHDDFASRDITGVTVALDAGRMAEAVAMIQAFRAEFVARFNPGPRTAVYQLAVQLFRLDAEP